jgi:creatinine amidohydrolase
MQYIKMLPWQVRQAIERGSPVVLPLGVVEYHAEHLPLGVDSFVVEEAVRRVEKEHPDLVVLPTFYYGTASFAVAAPEANGTINIDSAHLVPLAEDIFRSLLRIGFRNIHVFIAHQTEEFGQGMPTDLAFRLAARRVVFAWLDQVHGEGWWGTKEFSSYYSGENNPFSWISVHPVRSRPATRAAFPADHAGRLETSEMLAMLPECVDLSRKDGKLWYAAEAGQATAAYGDAALAAAAGDIAAILYGGGADDT